MINAKFKRAISLTLAVLFVFQILVFGDGKVQGLLTAKAFENITEYFEELQNHNALAEEFDDVTSGLGEVEYFDTPVTYQPGMGFSSSYLDDSDSTEEYFEPNFYYFLSLSGYVVKGDVNGVSALDNTPISVHIFDENWNEITSTLADADGYYSVDAEISWAANVKFECDGYLPLYLKNFGTGDYEIGTGDYLDEVTLIPGDTTFLDDEYNSNAWSDDVLNENDVLYVESLIGITADTDEFKPYMDKDGNGVIDENDVQWFVSAYNQYGSQNSDSAYKKNLTLLSDAYFYSSFDLKDTNLYINGYYLYVDDSMSFTTSSNTNFWANGEGALLDVNYGTLEVVNNFNFRTESPDGWGVDAGQTLYINNGTIYIGGDFNFGQANCYDVIDMTNEDDYLAIYGGWNYVTSADCDGLWTNGEIDVFGDHWYVNEASGAKSVYSSENHRIVFDYEYGKQYIYWHNNLPGDRIYDANGNSQTERTLNFDNEDGIYLVNPYTDENYSFHPSLPDYYEPDYSMYHRGWEIGDGVHIATGNFTKTFADLSVKTPGMDVDFVRTYNSTNTEFGSFGKGWDFNFDVSKIRINGDFYQVILPDGSNSAFKKNGSVYENQNDHNTFENVSGGYLLTIPNQTKYYYGYNLELFRITDPHGDSIEISSINTSNGIRTITDSTGRSYEIHYTSIWYNKHIHITEIIDTTSGRTVVFSYNSQNQLISSRNTMGAIETYDYNSNGHLFKFTNYLDEVTDEIVYYNDGKVNNIVNSLGLKQVYQYDKSKKQTSIKEYDGENLVKETKCDYDEKYAVTSNIIYASGKTYVLGKTQYTKDAKGVNKYNEAAESTDENGNTTKYSYDTNGNILQVINPDGTKKISRYNSKNYQTFSSDENNNLTISVYDNSGVQMIKQGKSLQALSADDLTSFLSAYTTDAYLNQYLIANASDFAITTFEYCTVGEQNILHGLIHKLIDPIGNITEYEYNSNGTVAKEWKYSGTVSKETAGFTAYEYNNMFLVSQTITPEGSVIKNFYDKNENVIRTENYGTNLNSTPAVTRAEYDLLGRLTKEISPNFYNSSLELGVSNIYDFNNTSNQYTQYTYYPSGLVKNTTNAVGNLTSYDYDGYGNLIKTTHPNNTGSLTEYDVLGRETKTYFQSTNGNNLLLTSTDYTIKSDYVFKLFNGNISANVTSPVKALNVKKTQYITAEKQVVSEELLDFRGNVVQEKVNGNVKRTNVYYANGLLGTESDANGNTTKYAYNSLGLQTAKFSPFYLKSDGSIAYSITKSTYDKNGNVIIGETSIQKQDAQTAKWSKTEYGYDYLGNVISATLHGDDNSKNYTQYVYNKDGQTVKMHTVLSALDDNDKLETLYQYDEKGNLIRTIEKSNDTIVYNSGTVSYDLNGNVTQSVDSIGNVTNKTYDALDRILSTETICDNSDKNFTQSLVYDNMGNTVQTTQDGIPTSFAYDSLGRLTTEHSYDYFKGYFYVGSTDNKARLLVGQSNKLLYIVTDYEYDSEMRLSKVSDNDIVAEYSYDLNGNKQQVSYSNGTSTEYTYNLSNHISVLTNKSGNNVISQYEYSYYLDGSDAVKTRIESGIIETTSYVYDKIGRLVTESETNGNLSTIINYSYDDFSNRSQMSVDGEIDYVTNYNYSLGGNYTGLLQKETKITGNVSQEIIYDYDANGNQISKNDPDNGLQLNEYDGINQLISVQNGESETTYTYGVDGLRRSKNVDGVKTTHVYDGTQLVVDIGASVYVANVYIRGTGLIAEFAFNENTAPTFYLQNAHGDIVNLTNQNGAKIKTYRYDAFGVEKNLDDDDNNPFRYSGEYFDKETGTIYLRARYYDPSIGRFITRDSVTGTANDPLSLNLYTYCRNNPLPFNDPDGHFWGLIARAAIGAIVNVAVTAVCDYLDDGKFNSGAGEYLASAAEGAISAVISPAKCAQSIGKRLVTSGIKDAAVGVVGDTIRQGVKGDFDVKEIALNAGKNFVSGAIAGELTKSCFTQGTLVETIDGDVAIEDIQLGDYVLSSNPETGEIGYRQVVNTFIHINNTLVYVSIGNELIETTLDHPFWVENQGWTNAKLLERGDPVRLKDGTNSTVDSVEVIEFPQDTYVTVYNFEVAEFHSYYVSGLDVLVHNTCDKKTYQTYSKTNSKTGEVYIGRTSGYGTPEQNVNKRDYGHHKTKDGFGKAKLLDTTDDYSAIRGQEQLRIEHFRGKGISGNKMNGIGPKNPKRGSYIRSAKKVFK